MKIIIKPTNNAKDGITFTIDDRTGTKYDLDLVSYVRQILTNTKTYSSLEGNVITPNKAISTYTWGLIFENVKTYFTDYGYDVVVTNGTTYTITNPNRVSRSSRAYRFRF